MNMAPHKETVKPEDLDGIMFTSVTASVLDYVRNKIITGEFKPGRKINESDIALNLNVSRTPVREAFRILEAQGLITTLARRGSFITEISFNDVIELFGIREVLEFHAIDGIKKRAKKSPDKFKALVNNLEIVLGKKPDNLTITPGFHRSLVQISGNYRLTELYKMVEGSCKRYWLIYYCGRKEKDTSLQHHQEIVTTLKREDFSEVKKLLKKHFSYVKDVLRQKIESILENE